LFFNYSRRFTLASHFRSLRVIAILQNGMLRALIT
jgi:hypothetical protein